MDETNDLSTNNTATRPATEAKSPYEAQSATATSDELSAPVDLNDPRVRTNYAKSKKIGKAVRNVTIITGVSLIAGGITIGAFNFLNKREASVSKASIIYKEGQITWSFVIDNNINRKIDFDIDLDGKNFFYLDVSTPNTYEGSVGNVPDFKEGIAKVVAKNNVDFKKTIYSVKLTPYSTSE